MPKPRGTARNGRVLYVVALLSVVACSEVELDNRKLDEGEEGDELVLPDIFPSMPKRLWDLFSEEEKQQTIAEALEYKRLHKETHPRPGVTRVETDMDGNGVPEIVSESADDGSWSMSDYDSDGQWDKTETRVEGVWTVEDATTKRVQERSGTPGMRRLTTTYKDGRPTEVIEVPAFIECKGEEDIFGPLPPEEDAPVPAGKPHGNAGPPALDDGLADGAQRVELGAGYVIRMRSKFVPEACTEGEAQLLKAAMVKAQARLLMYFPRMSLGQQVLEALTAMPKVTLDCENPSATASAGTVGEERRISFSRRLLFFGVRATAMTMVHEFIHLTPGAMGMGDAHKNTVNDWVYSCARMATGCPYQGATGMSRRLGRQSVQDDCNTCASTFAEKQFCGLTKNAEEKVECRPFLYPGTPEKPPSQVCIYYTDHSTGARPCDECKGYLTVACDGQRDPAGVNSQDACCATCDPAKAPEGTKEIASPPCHQYSSCLEKPYVCSMPF